MKSQILGLRVASAVFGLMSFGQLTRLLVRPEVVIEGYLLPLWPSIFAFIVLVGLSLWMWSLSRPQAG
jgi:hypothetical protein